MFKSRPSGRVLGSVGAMIAHSSTIPFSKSDSALQELIAAEKGLLTSVQRLAGDVGKSAEALKGWGVGEGSDLHDVPSHSTNLIHQFSAALTQFASYEEHIRTQLKSIRTREENLDSMKERKRSVDLKADATDKKVTKMGSESKGRTTQVELLNELKDEGRRLEIDIINEEAAIGDYKRRGAREFLGLKFAEMVELAEKTRIVGEWGKLLVEVIPLHTTPPGHPRAPYTGLEKASELSSEALRRIGEVRLNLPSWPEAASPATSIQPHSQPIDVDSPTSPGRQRLYSESGGPTGGSSFSTGLLRSGDDEGRIGNMGAEGFYTPPASAGLPPVNLGDHRREETFSSSVANAPAHDPEFSGQHGRPALPPRQLSIPTGTQYPPQGPPGAYVPPQISPSGAPHPSKSYSSGGQPDPTQTDSQLVPPHVLSNASLIDKHQLILKNTPPIAKPSSSRCSCGKCLRGPSRLK